MPSPPSEGTSAERAFAAPQSRPVRATDFASEAYAFWRDALKLDARRHRKAWEYAIALQALARGGMLAPGRQGLGFGVGKEPLVAVMARHGVDVLATDAPPDIAGHDWIDTDQHAMGLADLNRDGLCDPETFRRRVRFRFLDMRAIPDDLRGFDFCWSLCALEHLGSLEAGLAFVRASLDTLRPGGLAVHTTELACRDDGPTLETGPIVVYRRDDLVRFAVRLQAEGHRIDLDLRLDDTPLDRFVDEPPYREDPHLRLRLGDVVTTSVVLIVRKAGAEHAVLP